MFETVLSETVSTRFRGRLSLPFVDDFFPLLSLVVCWLFFCCSVAVLLSLVLVVPLFGAKKWITEGEVANMSEAATLQKCGSENFRRFSLPKLFVKFGVKYC